VGPLALALAQLVTLAAVVDPGFVAGLHPTTLMSDRLDYDAHATVAAQRLRRGSISPLDVIYTGNSAAVEALDDPAAMGADLSGRVSADVGFHFLATLGQTLWETVILVDELPAELRGLVIIGVSPVAVTMSRARLRVLLDAPRLALDSAAFRDEVARAGLEPPAHTGIYLLDHGRFFVARRLAVLRRPWGLLPLDTHHYTRTRPAWTREDWRIRAPEIPEQVDLSRLAELTGLLGRMLDRLLAREGLRVVLLEAPQHPLMTVGLGEKAGAYREAILAVAARDGAEYWRLDEEAGLEAGDFHDWGHLGRPEARRRYQEVLARRAAALLERVKREAKSW
jgi:hypothetical protein